MEKQAVLIDVMDAMERVEAAVALVTDGGSQTADSVVGWIGPAELAAATRKTARLMV